jgi:hypothetical protein
MPPTDKETGTLIYWRVGTFLLAMDVAYVEDVPKYVGRAIPSSSAAVLFYNFGLVMGILTARGIRVVLVRPQDWQKPLDLGTRRACRSAGEWKNKLKAEAQRRFPELKVTLKTADALLILDYGRTQELKTNG